jgi:hypothetical protein
MFGAHLSGNVHINTNFGAKWIHTFSKSHKGNALATSVYQTVTSQDTFSDGCKNVTKALRVYIHMNLFNVLRCPETILHIVTRNKEASVFQSPGVREIFVTQFTSIRGINLNQWTNSEWWKEPSFRNQMSQKSVNDWPLQNNSRS